MVNPAINVRAAYFNIFQNGLSVPSFVEKVPLGIEPPESYVLISGQSKQEKRVCKQCPQNWTVNVTLDIIKISEAGNSDRLHVDTIEQEIMNLILECNDFTIPGFKIGRTILTNSLNLDLDIDTQDLDRQVLTIEHHLEEI
ncbi:MAG TPA: hypothetical protein VIH28_08420 [Ignavibacteriaceae bacterium]